MTMSDRIAVMNDDHLEQVGDREALYHYPVNLFVDNFIGNPSMNFLDATVESLTPETEVVTLEGTTLEFETDRLMMDRNVSDVILGVRPISLSFRTASPGDGFTGEIVLLGPIDDRALVTIQTSQGEVIALIPAENDFSVGEEVALSVDTDNLYLFDPDTEELIVKSGNRN